VRLNEQMALVTGAARGIGFAVASRLAAEGAAVAVCDRNGPGAEAAAARLKAGGARAVGLTMDVSEEESVDSGVNRACAELGKLTIAVNAAGVWSAFPIDVLPFEEWRRIQAVNLDGAFLIARAAFREMKKHAYGRIINISSGIFIDPYPGYSHYAASKGGMIALTRSLAVEGGPLGITCNSIAPGTIASEGALATHKDEGFAYALGVQAVKRRGEPEDIADAVAYFASPKAGFVTGQTLYLNGGTRF
jgi:NAD(P)-dependent dehydrogenase (short-subunit alcohol dehydrogenase family)